jgi:predicted neuraminidase
LAKLRDGSLVVAFNNSSAGLRRDKTRASVRKPLSIALSLDGGTTWPWFRDIETGSPAEQADEVKGSRNKHEEYSYPSLLQDANGKIILAYSYNREAIKVVRFDEGWIKQGHTADRFKGDDPS